MPHMFLDRVKALELEEITVTTAATFTAPPELTCECALVTEPRSTPPASPKTHGIYLDDGTNTADGKMHFRYWNGSAWSDIG